MGSFGLCDMKKKGRNDIPRTLQFPALRPPQNNGARHRGREYKLLRESLSRLQATTIATNIRADKGKRSTASLAGSRGFPI